MAVAWFICPYKTIGQQSRYCAMDDFSSQIITIDGGYWEEIEVLGDRAIVKVNASVATLIILNAVPGFKRLPKDALNSPLSDLTAGQKTALKNEILDMGYTAGELSAWFGNDGVNIGNFTLKDVLKRMATRRLQPDSIDGGGNTVFTANIVSIPGDKALEYLDNKVK